MTEQEVTGYAILSGLVLGVLLIVWLLHEHEERTFYRNRRIEAEKQRADIIQQIREGRL